MSDVDVLVIGAGPAGCAAAIGSARSGLTTALLERAAFPRDRPGETLHPGVESLFRALGVANRILSRGFLRHDGHWVQWAGPARFEAFGGDASGAWRGFQAPRAELDAMLLERARDAGAAVVQPCRATAALLRGGRVVGAGTSGGPIMARFVVDATGGGHWLTRGLGRAPQIYSPRLVTRYGYARGDCPARNDAPAIVADTDGWTWTARIRPKLYAWARLWVRERASEREWRPEELRGLDAKGRTLGADVTWRRAPRPAGPGYFIAGDAAAVLDPASSHGVLKALMSGTLAAHSIVQVLQGKASERDAARDYSKWLRGWFEHDVQALDQLYQVFPGWSRMRDSADSAWSPARGRGAGPQDRSAG